MTAFPELQVLGMDFDVRPSELSSQTRVKRREKRGVMASKKQGKMKNQAVSVYMLSVKVTSKVPKKRPQSHLSVGHKNASGRR